MAIPKSRFKSSKCGQDLVICANGNFKHGKVRDRSEIEAWEVSHGIQDALGVSPYAKFTGAIYADENDDAFKTDTKCRKAKPAEKSSTTPAEEPETSPTDTGGQTAVPEGAGDNPGNQEQ